MRKLFLFLKKIDKRQRLSIAVVIILIFNLIITLFPLKVVLFLIPLNALIIYIATYVALLEDIEHIEWVVLFVLPIYFAISLLLFYYLLPVRWLTRIPYLAVLAVGTYASILCMNIFNVGIEKSLPLYRAAYSVSNFISLFCFFLIYTVLYSFRLNFLLNFVFGLVLAWPLFFHNIWSSNPKSVLEERIYKFATINTLLLAGAIFILNFMPIKTSIYALYTVAISYLLTGLTQEIITDTVFKERVREYLIVFGLLSILVIASASWG